jgi:hypothetical protein
MPPAAPRLPGARHPRRGVGAAAARKTRSTCGSSTPSTAPRISSAASPTTGLHRLPAQGQGIEHAVVSIRCAARSSRRRAGQAARSSTAIASASASCRASKARCWAPAFPSRATGDEHLPAYARVLAPSPASARGSAVPAPPPWIWPTWPRDASTRSGNGPVALGHGRRRVADPRGRWPGRRHGRLRELPRQRQHRLRQPEVLQGGAAGLRGPAQVLRGPCGPGRREPLRGAEPGPPQQFLRASGRPAPPLP